MTGSRPLGFGWTARTMPFDLRQLGRRGGDEHLDRTYQPAQFDAPVVKGEEYEVVAPVHLERGPPARAHCGDEVVVGHSVPSLR